MTNSKRLLRTLVSALYPLAALAFLLVYVKAYPIWETWYFIDAWHQLASGGDWLHSLFIPRWGHIHALPNAVNLFVGHVSCYDMAVDAVLSWGVAVLALVVVSRQLPPSAMLALGVGSAWFTLRLAEVWLSSWNLMWPLSLLQAALIGTCLSRPGWVRLGWAALVGLSGIFTAGQGLAIVAAGFAPLLVHVLHNRRSIAPLLVWLVFTLGCYMAYSRMTGVGASTASLAAISADNLLGLLSYSAGEGDMFRVLVPACFGFALVLGLAGIRRLQIQASDVFWLYMVALLMVLVVLLAAQRPGHFLSRYLMFLWIAPAAIAYLLFRVSEGSRTIGIVTMLLCGVWIANNTLQSYRFERIVHGWEALSARAVTLAKNDPDAIKPEMMIGIAAHDVQLVASGLTTMKAMRVNMFCARQLPR